MPIGKAEKLIKEIQQYGSAIPRPHARERMREMGYSIRDVVYILEQDEITDVEEASRGGHNGQGTS